MAKKLITACCFPGCPNLTQGRYCKQHSNIRRIEDKNYKARRTDIEEQAFYKTVRWRKLRAWKLKQYPLCEVCGAVAVLVDHIVPIKEGGEPLLAENLQSMCVACHNRKHKA